MPPALESKLDEFIDRYSPEIAAQVRRARKKLRKRFPRGFELVYDNYNALVFAFAASERMADVMLSIAAYPRWVTLFFMRGKSLKDPERLLQGSGKHIRSIVLDPPTVFDAASTQGFITQAEHPHLAKLGKAPRLTTIVRSVSKKQRPRRPAKT